MNLPSSFPHILYSPPGANSTSLGDIDVISHDGVIHLFYLTLPNHHTIGHAVSKDGLSWETANPALTLGRAGAFDDDMLWTMQVVRHPSSGRFLMYYTGCSTREDGQVQRIGLAVSDDLHCWTRFGEGPILEAAPPHYLCDQAKVGFVSFRDPYVFHDAKGWHMLVTARVADGPRFRSGCVAHAESADGFAWTLREPLFQPAQYEDIEVPSLLRGPSKWALFFNEFSVSQTHVRVSARLNGPWLRPEVSEPLPVGNAVFRFCAWRDKTLLFHWIRSEADWKRRSGSPGQRYPALSMPKEVRWNRRGEPELVSFEGWNRLGRRKPLSALEMDLGDSGWRSGPDSLLRCGTVERCEVLSKKRYGDLLLEGTLETKNARRAEVLFRADDQAEGFNSIELNFEHQRVEFHRYSFRDVSVQRFKLSRPTLVQAASLKLPARFRETFRLIACGEYVEFSLGGRVLLSAASYHHKTGRFGFAMVEGEGKIVDASAAALKIPYRR